MAQAGWNDEKKNRMSKISLDWDSRISASVRSRIIFRTDDTVFSIYTGVYTGVMPGISFLRPIVACFSVAYKLILIQGKL